MDTLDLRAGLNHSLHLRTFAASPPLQHITIEEKVLPTPFSLIELPLNKSFKTFLLSQKELFSPHGECLKKDFALLPRLDVQGIERLRRVFDCYDMPAGLLHIIPDIVQLGIDPNSAFKIVGSGVFWILGQNYVIARFAEVGINLEEIFCEQELADFFKEPADIDIRIDLWEADNKVLETIGRKIAHFLASRQNANKLKFSGVVSWKGTVDVGINRCYTFKLSHVDSPISIDIVTAGMLNVKYLFDSDDCFLPLTTLTLEMLGGFREQKVHANFTQVEIVPNGEKYHGWRGVLLRLMSRRVSENPGRIDFRGGIKYLVTLAEGKLPVLNELDDKLFSSFFRFLAYQPSKAMKEIFRAIENHYGDNRAALTAVQFNLLRYLYSPAHDLTDYFFPIQRSGNLFSPVPQVAKVVSVEMMLIKLNEFKAYILASPQIISKGRKETSQPTYFKALSFLMSADELSYEALSAFLLLHAHLLESRKMNMRQKSKMLAVSDQVEGKQVTLFNWGGKGEILLLPHDLLSALKALETNFIGKNYNDSLLSKLEVLSKPCFKGVLAQYTPPEVYEGSSSDDEIQKLSAVASYALKFLTCPALRSEGFLLLCLCGLRIKTASYLPQLSAVLLDVLSASTSTSERAAIFIQFLQYLENCQPEEVIFERHSTRASIFQPVGELNNFISQLENLNILSNSLSINGCKVLAFINNVHIGKMILHVMKQQPERNLTAFAENIMAKYLYINAPSLALDVLNLLVKNKQVSYGNLDTHLNRIFSVYKRHSDFMLNGLLRLVYVAEEMLKKMTMRDKLGVGANAYLEIVDCLLIENNLAKAASLLQAASLAGVSAVSPEIICAKRLEICMHYLEANQWEAALSQWQEANIKLKEAASISSKEVENLLTPLLHLIDKEMTPKLYLQWVSLLLKAPIEKLSSEPAQQYLLFLTRALKRAGENQIHLFQAQGSWLLNQVDAFYRGQEHINSMPRHFEIYFKIANSIGPVNSENAAIHAILGAYCFNSFVILQNSKEISSPTIEISAIIEEMLKSTAIRVQTDGFKLLCNSEYLSGNSKHLIAILSALPNLLTSEETIEERRIIFDEFCKFIAHSNIDFVTKQQLSPLYEALAQDGSNDLILKAFCESFSKLSAPITFEAVFACWQKIELDKLSVAMMLINNYQENHPDLALAIMAAQVKLGGLSSTDLGKCWNKFLNGPKVNLEGCSQTQLLHLSQIALALIPRMNRDKAAFSKDLFLLIDLLFHAKESSLAINLYEIAESKKLFTNISTLSSSVQFNLCRAFFDQGKKGKAYFLCSQLLTSQNAADVMELLLDWSEKGLEGALIELLLKGLEKNLPSEQAFRCAQHILAFYSEQKEKNLSTDWQKVVKSQINHIISSLKLAVEEGKSNVWDLFYRLFKLFPRLNLDLANTMEEWQLWLAFYQHQKMCENWKKDLLPIFGLLISAHDKQSKSVNDDKASVYLLLAEHYLLADDFLNTSRCLERVLINLQEAQTLQTHELKLFSKCFSGMINNPMFLQASALLEKMEAKKLAFSKKWFVKSWSALALKAKGSLPALSAKILIDKSQLLVSAGLTESLLELATAVCLQLVKSKSNAEQQQFIKISNFYRITAASVWLPGLQSLNFKNSDETLFKNIASLPDPFTGAKEDCQECWLAFLKQLPDKYCPLFMRLLINPEAIFSLFEGEKAHRSQELTLWILKKLAVLLDEAAMPVAHQMEIYQKMTALMSACQTLSSQIDEFYYFELKLIDYALKNLTYLPLEKIVARLAINQPRDLSKHKQSYFNLVQTAIEQFFHLEISWESTAGQQLAQMANKCWKQLDPAIFCCVELLNLNEQTCSRVMNLLFLEKRRSKNVFTQAQKLLIANSLEKLFGWLVLKKQDKQFEELLNKVADASLIPPGRLKHWNTVKLKNFLAATLSTTENVPALTVNISTLIIYKNELPKIAGESAAECHKLAAQLYVSISESPSDMVALITEILQPSSTNIEEAILLNIFILLADLFKAHVELDEDNLKEPWQQSLRLVTEGWKLLLKDKCLGTFVVITEKCNQIFEDLTGSINKIYPPRKHAISPKNQKSKINGHGNELQLFLGALIDAMLDLPAVDSDQKLMHLTIVYFYLNMFIQLFPKNSTILSKIQKICFDRSFHDDTLFHYQFALVETFLAHYCAKGEASSDFAEHYFLISLQVALTPTLMGDYKEDYDKQREGMLRVISSLCNEEISLYSYRAIDIMSRLQNSIFNNDIAAITSAYEFLIKPGLCSVSSSELEVQSDEERFEYKSSFWDSLAHCVSKIDQEEVMTNVIVSMMPLVVTTLADRNNFLFFMESLYLLLPEEINLLYRYLDLWRTHLQAFHHHNESKALLENKFFIEVFFNNASELDRYLKPLLARAHESLLKDPYEEKDLKKIKSVLQTTAIVRKFDALATLQYFYLDYFELLIKRNQSRSDQQNYFSFLLDEFNEVDKITHYWGRKFIVAPLKIFLLEVLAPLAALRSTREEHEAFFRCFASVHPIDDSSFLTLFNILENWIEKLQENGHANTAQFISMSKLRTQLLFNSSKLIIPKLESMLLSATATVHDFFGETLVPNNQLAQCIEEAPIDQFFDIPEGDLTTLIPFWKYIGEQLISVKEVRAQQSVKGIKNLLINYFSMIVFLSVPQSKVKFNDEQLTELLTVLPLDFFEHAAEVRQTLQESSSYTFLLDLLKKAQQLPFMRTKIIEILHMYELLMPLALLQDKSGRQEFYLALQNYYHSHDKTISWTLNDKKTLTCDYFHHTFEKWLICCIVDFKDEAIQMANENFGKRLLCSSPIALAKLCHTIMYNIRSNPNRAVNSEMTIGNAYMSFLIEYVRQKSMPESIADVDSESKSSEKSRVETQILEKKKYFKKTSKYTQGPVGVFTPIFLPSYLNIRSIHIPLWEFLGKFLTQSETLSESEMFFDAMSNPLLEYFDLVLELSNSSEANMEYHRCYQILIQRIIDIRRLPYIDLKKQFVKKLFAKLVKLVEFQSTEEQLLFTHLSSEAVKVKK